MTSYVIESSYIIFDHVPTSQNLPKVYVRIGDEVYFTTILFSSLFIRYVILTFNVRIIYFMIFEITRWLVWQYNTGKTLYETFEMQGIDIGPSSVCAKPETPRTETWMEPTFGEGPTSGYDHVVLTGKGTNEVIRPNYAEQQQLEDYWEWDEIG